MRAHLLAGAALAALSLSLSVHAQPASTASVAVVSGRDAVAVHDLATGAERARFATPGGSTDIQMTPAGVAILNHTAGNQLILIDAAAAREIGRIPASGIGATRPVHAYLSHPIDGRQFFVVLNDGVEANTPVGQRPADSSMLLVNITPGQPRYLEAAGEVRLGRGHHKAAFSTRRPRVAISNIADCADVITVYDYTNPREIAAVKTFSAADFGFDGATAARTCDETGRRFTALAPHGSGSSLATGRAFHFITGTGQIAAIDIDAEVPSLAVISTSGVGGNAVKDFPGGAFMVAAQRTPREIGLRGQGETCQVGQIAIIDAAGLNLAAQVPIRYDGPDCTRSLVGAPEANASPAYPITSADGKLLFIQLGTIAPAAGQRAETRMTALFDISNPRRPVQLPSIAVGAGNGARENALSGDGSRLLTPDTLADTVSVIGVTERRMVASFATVAAPSRVVTFGPEGPSKPVGPAGAAK
jgi:hypothetical protein